MSVKRRPVDPPDPESRREGVSGGKDAWFEILFEYAPDAYYIVDLKGTFLDGNRAAEKLVGYPREQLIGKNFVSVNLLSPGQIIAASAALARNMVGQPTGPDEFTLRRADGTLVPVETRTYPVTINGKRVVLGIARDLTERKGRDERLRSLMRATEQSPAGVVITDTEGRIEFVNTAFTEITGYSAAEVQGENPRILQSGQTPPEVYEDLWRTITAGEVWRGDLLNRRKDGSLYWDSASISPVRDENGTITHFVAVKEDVTERTRTRIELREANERLRALVEAAPLAIFAIDLERRVQNWNPAAERLFGWTEAEVLGRPLPYVGPAEQADVERNIARVLAEGPLLGVPARRLRKDGSHVDISLSVAPLHDASGSVTGMLGIAEDVGSVKALEQQLRQAQKMEAVGQLAGGIAHDFNNILTAITGFAELALSTLTPDHAAREDVDQIHAAAKRAAALTRQLLAFSRQQVLAPAPIHLGDLVDEMRAMLHRLLREDIALTTRSAKDLGTVHADPGQLQQVVMNLAVNARDAMPNGGALRIEVANVELDDAYAKQHVPVTPGPYVLLSVSDTGVGMDAATQARIFEPFFTTKGAGRGTGLGLSTVYGIVKQSDGFIWAYSEPGQGTTFKIYLPRVDRPAVRTRRTPQPVIAAVGTETILLAEDDEAVRRVTERALALSGYHVLAAASGDEALDVAETHGSEIDLLITDVVMPRMRGDELAKRLRRTYPSLRVLFTSGYTGEHARGTGVIPPSAAFLQKPFTIEEITQGVRRVLDTEPDAA